MLPTRWPAPRMGEAVRPAVNRTVNHYMGGVKMTRRPVIRVTTRRTTVPSRITVRGTVKVRVTRTITIRRRPR